MGGLTNTGTVICKISRIALDGGVMFETMTNRDNPMQMKRSYLQFTVQYQFLEKRCYADKMGYFKKSCLTNCHKMLNFANFRNGIADFKGASCV